MALTVHVGAPGHNVSFGVLNGTGSFTVTGGGSLSFSGANNFSGQVIIDSTLYGYNTYATTTTLSLIGGGDLDSASVLLNQFGSQYPYTKSVLNIAATTAGASIASLSGSGAVVLGNQTLTVADASGTFTGPISGSGGLSVTGGTQMLNGASTYSGPTIIAQALQLRWAHPATSQRRRKWLRMGHSTLPR